MRRSSCCARRPEERSDREAAALVEGLGRFALAVEQAGAYLAQTGWDYGRYRQLLLSRTSELLARNAARLRDAAEQDVTVMTVWDISVQQATREAPAAGAVLDLLAYLAADDIPMWLLDGGPLEGEPLVADGDQLQLAEAVAGLVRYSLLDRDQDSSDISTLSVHRLVQEVARIRHAEQDTTGEWVSLAVRLLRRAVPAELATVVVGSQCRVHGTGCQCRA